MSLTLGKKMLRVEDGMRGEVKRCYDNEHDLTGTLRVIYMDRGEHRIAPPKETWIEADPVRLPLREEEIREVAAVADHWLKCIEQHLPRYSASPLAPGMQIPGGKLPTPHDPGLVTVIVEYLKGRV